MTERIRVVIADDHPVVRVGLRDMLSSQPDFDVVAEAVNGAEAVTLATRLQPHVILMDLRMPEMDGVTAIAHIKAEHQNIQILVLTTYDSDSDILPAVEVGATGYLLKDAPREELFQAIRAAAQGKPVLTSSIAAHLIERMRSPTVEALTSREIDVLKLVAKGAHNKEIASQLCITEATVKSHLIRIYGKLGEDLEKRVAERTEQLKTAMAKQQEEAQERERIEHELQVARLIQQTLLPKSAPELKGYQIAAYYQPAREVGGDFYDFFEVGDGRLGLVVGDASGKGIPAALVMANTRSVLRTVAQSGGVAPGQVLEEANEILYPDIPANMFVTCFYAILDPKSGRLLYANAGHDLPYLRRRRGECEELRARGMPLGLMPGMSYEQKEMVLDAGEGVLFYSDGLVEAHNPEGEMFGFPRLRRLVAEHGKEGSLLDFLMDELRSFTEDEWEQEDDITLVTLQRSEEL
jgi:serine phosphatase RsbU (regulator of sigma subunit)/CheY-like chemotaxis protein